VTAFDLSGGEIAAWSFVVACHPASLKRIVPRTMLV
jgi:hypothetical protein